MDCCCDGDMVGVQQAVKQGHLGLIFSCGQGDIKAG